MITSTKGFLDDIIAVPAERYRGISTTDLLVYVVSQMHAHGVKLAFEPIVVAAYRFFPESFSLVGFSQYPDASRVGRTLLQCRPQYRGLIKGGASSGFVITELGKARTIEVERRLATGEPSKRPARQGKPRALVNRMEQEIRSSDAFAAWTKGEPITEYDFYHFLHLLPGSSRESVRANFYAIQNAAEDSEDSRVKPFLAALKKQYSKEL